MSAGAGCPWPDCPHGAECAHATPDLCTSAGRVQESAETAQVRPMLDEAGYAWEEPALPPYPMPSIEGATIRYRDPSEPPVLLSPEDVAKLEASVRRQPPDEPRDHFVGETRAQRLLRHIRETDAATAAIRAAHARQRAHDAGIVGRGEG